MTGARQRGVALFISLVLLLVLTIIGVSAVQTTSLEERMSRNTRDVALAFQAAESSLRDAEAFLDTVVSTVDFVDSGANGLWTVAPLDQPARWSDGTIWQYGLGVSISRAYDAVNSEARILANCAFLGILGVVLDWLVLSGLGAARRLTGVDFRR